MNKKKAVKEFVVGTVNLAIIIGILFCGLWIVESFCRWWGV